MDGGNVFDFSPGAAGRAADRRLRGAAGLRAHAPQKEDPEAERVGSVRRALEAVSKRGELVHVEGGASESSEEGCEQFKEGRGQRKEKREGREEKKAEVNSPTTSLSKPSARSPILA